MMLELAKERDLDLTVKSVHPTPPLLSPQSPRWSPEPAPSGGARGRRFAPTVAHRPNGGRRFLPQELMQGDDAVEKVRPRPCTLFLWTRQFTPSHPVQTAAALEGCDAVIGGQFMRNSVEVAEKLGGSLKLMMMTSAGYDEHNHGGPEVLEGLAKAGVMACNNGGTNAIAVAEIAVMLMLMVGA